MWRDNNCPSLLPTISQLQKETPFTPYCLSASFSTPHTKQTYLHKQIRARRSVCYTAWRILNGNHHCRSIETRLNRSTRYRLGWNVYSVVVYHQASVITINPLLHEKTKKIELKHMMMTKNKYSRCQNLISSSTTSWLRNKAQIIESYFWISV